MDTFPFDVNKAVQAIGVLHSTEGADSVSYYRLLKLLYIADRELLQETGRPIVGGKNVAMKKGPLNSPVYNLIKGEHQDAPHWQHFFVKNRRYLTMKENPGTDDLSAKEIRKLHEVSERLGERDDEELHAIVQGFPEYRENYQEGTSSDISLDSELNAIGMGDQSASIHADIERMAAWKQLLGANGVDIGDVFLPTDKRINLHPRIIISHPESDPDEVVLVNFTGDDEFYKDDSCVIQPDEHGWLSKPTCISYRDAKLAKESDLDRLLAEGRIEQLESATNALITKIPEGAEKTEFLPGKCRRVLERQGLIST